MTDKKFTDEEIIETLERCSKRDGCFGCAKAYMHSENCIRILEAECLDLINRQKAEVERYKRYYYRHEYDKWEKEIKTEAYQEFAKFLIDKSSKGLLRTSGLPDFVKEMVGEEGA